jgi:hypothetical protein
LIQRISEKLAQRHFFSGKNTLRAKKERDIIESEFITFDDCLKINDVPWQI